MPKAVKAPIIFNEEYGDDPVEPTSASANHDDPLNEETSPIIVAELTDGDENDEFGNDDQQATQAESQGEVSSSTVPDNNTTNDIFGICSKSGHNDESPSTTPSGSESMVGDLIEVPKLSHFVNIRQSGARRLSWVGSTVEGGNSSSSVNSMTPRSSTASLAAMEDLLRFPTQRVGPLNPLRRNGERISLMGSFMESFNTEVAYAHLKTKDACYFKNVVGWTSILLLTAAYTMARFFSRKFHHPNLHLATYTWLLLTGYTFCRKKYRVLVSDADRTLFMANVVVSTVVGFLLIMFFESSCMHCAFYVVEETAEGGIGLMDAAEFLLVEAGESDRKTLACQACTSAFFSFFFYFMDSPVVSFAEGNDVQLNGLEHITDIVSLAHSIDESNAQNKTADAESFQRKILYEVAQKGHLDIGQAFRGYLCSPSSRVVGDTAVEFLDRINEPRFSGESINLTVAQMSSIMRGDILKELGVAACFILRFALFVPEDPAIDHIKIETGSPPIMSEDELKALDVTADIPGLIIPQIDPQVDKQGVAIMLTKTLMDAYVKFPFNNDPIYFETRDEYFFFYRWNMVRRICDGLSYVVFLS